jgi:hypothetical protein
MKTITLSNEVLKAIKLNEYYSDEQFLSDANQWIKSIEQNRVICSVVSVSKSGMSRKLKFLSFEPNKDSDKGYYRQYNTMLKTLGYKLKDYSITVNGCGMDMIFHTNYSIIHDFKRMGIITSEQCKTLCQMTPTNI